MWQTLRKDEVLKNLGTDENFGLSNEEVEKTNWKKKRKKV